MAKLNDSCHRLDSSIDCCIVVIHSETEALPFHTHSKKLPG